MILKITAALLITFSIASPSFAVTYLLQDLGTLGGNISTGIAINDFGHAMGTTLMSNGALRTFFWDGNSMMNLGSPVAGVVSGRNINNNDHIVGHAGFQSFRWTPSTGFDFLDPNNFGTAEAINNNNEVVGESYEVDYDQSLFWSATNTKTAINPSAASWATGINDLSQIVGSVFGSVSTTGYYAATPNAPLQSIPIDYPHSINDSRLIVGSVGNETAAIYDYDTSTFTSLGFLSPNHVRSRALGVNNYGIVVGESYSITPSDNAGFIYDSVNGMQDLTSLLHSDFAGWKILGAADINESGQIIASGQFNVNGKIEGHAVILTPIPEPMPILIAFVALASIAICCAKSQKNIA